MNEQPTHIDLFSGIGGFALAAAWAGFRTVAFCEIEPYPQAILKARFGAVLADAGRTRQSAGRTGGGKATVGEVFHHRVASGSPDLWSDIRTLDGRLYAGASLLTGGFPCQPFSVAGKRRGKEDNRFLWPEMLRVVSEARPTWVLGENVAGLINMELDRCLSDLEAIGYACWPLVIPACAVDAKHRRDRVWIVGYAERAERRPNTQRRGCCEQGQHSKRQAASGTGESSQALANGISARLEEQQCEPRDNGQEQQAAERSCDCGARWIAEPDVGRVAHGIPSRVDRLKGLGNAIVTKVAFQILREIRKLITV